MTKPRADAADIFLTQLRVAGIVGAVREYRFAAEHVGRHPGVKERLKRAGLQDWRLDLSWPSIKVACEVDGGVYVMGGHNRGAHMESDRAKLSSAVAMGWAVLTVTPRHVKQGRALQWVEAVLALRGYPKGADLPPRWIEDNVS